MGSFHKCIHGRKTLDSIFYRWNSRGVSVYTMQLQDEVLEIFVRWKKVEIFVRWKKVTRLDWQKIKVHCSYNNGEYPSDPFLQVWKNEDIQWHFTVKETTQHNGVAYNMDYAYWIRCSVCYLMLNHIKHFGRGYYICVLPNQQVVFDFFMRQDSYRGMS